MRFLPFSLLLLMTAPLEAVAQESTAVADFDEAAIEFFEKAVRPLLAKRCYECHSSESDEPAGGLRLDSRQALIAGGDTGPAIVPNKPADSLLVDAINYGEVYEMPPKSKMPPSEIAVLEKWIEMGAPWPKEEVAATQSSKVFDISARKAEHWCWQPVRDPTPPPVRTRDWPKQPLDNFILAKLEDAGITPAGTTDRRTLIRRAYFDLIGLPPSPAEVDAFLSDESEDAFERVIDGLLDSPHFGERWARHWMDLMRYAETYGHEFDYPIPHAFKYRDYLIRAFNDDVPYDRFVMEHIAGDLLPSPRLHDTEGYDESVTATTSWWLGEATHAPVDVLGDESGRIDNQIDVFSKTFLGLTVACARCHDHKFDAISTTDYYALAGFLQSSRRDEALLDPHGQVAAAASRLNSLKQEGDAVVMQAYANGDASAERFAQYLLAAREVAFGKPKETTSPSEEDRDLVFEDFESETYEGWTTEGTAFGAGPQSRATTPGYQGDIGAVGNHWVNSHNTRGEANVARGDQHVGTLTSRDFVIDRHFIKFLIGGGNHKDKTCVNLLVGGQIVRSQTGFNQNKMRPVQFDVGEFLGKQAKIQVVDQETGGWGNIGIDEIVFSNGNAVHRRPVDEVATEFSVDPVRLARWVTALSSAEAQEPSHPLYVWCQLAESMTAQKTAALRALAERRAESSRALDERYPLFTGFDNLDGWFVTGHAFGAGPTQQGEWDASRPNPTRLRPGEASSNRIENRLQGTLRSPTFTLEHPNIYYRLKGEGVKIRLVLDGYFMDTFSGLLFRGFTFEVKSPDRLTWYRQSDDVGRYIGHRGYIEILDYGDGAVEIDEIRFSDDGPPSEPIDSVAAKILADDVITIEELANAYGAAWCLATSADTTSDENDSPRASDLVTLWNWVASNDLLPTNAEVAERLVTAHTTMQKVDVPSAGRVLGLTDGTGENGHIYVRGNHRTPGKEVTRTMLEALRSRPVEITSGSGRLQLAEQIVAPENPLTARVMVNRIWHHLTGRGIVASTDNFGVLGQPPTHPDLLDHLASGFIRDGWSIKRLIKQIMLSTTYQMASTPDEAGDTRDPENLLLHRARIRRLQAEAIRDSVLAISGRLDRTMFGPSVPVHITPFMQGRGRPGNAGPLDGNGRRSLYIEVRRNFLSPMMLAFDTPIPFSAVGNRNASNVPAQALTMMNDPFVVEQAKLWADRVIAAETTTESRINAMYVDAFARPPSQRETDEATEFLRQQSGSLGLTEVAANYDERAWADLCHVLINVKEFVFLK